MLVKTAEKHHYNPRPVDEEFSALVGSALLKMMDAQGFLFTREEVQQIESWQDLINDDIAKRQCAFVENVADLYQKKLFFIDSLLGEYQHNQFDFTVKDRLIFSKNQPYVEKEKLLKKWEGYLKFQILSSARFDNDSATGLSDEKISELQDRVITREICKIKSKLNHSGGLKKQVSSRFLKAITLAFDPHSHYFSSPEKQEFEEMLSIEAASYGFQLSRNELGEIEVYGIVPGGPAWNSNAVNEGDVILYVKTPEGKVKDFNCLAMEEANHFIASPNINEALFHLLKKNGEELDVTLFKEQLSVEENVIQSFILEGERKTGYIYLPSFYSQHDFTRFTDGCANDLAKELIKLKRENIEGLVMDLRNNGGGSMLEAIRMAGIFIDYGAVGIIDSRHDKPVTLNDPNRGTVFTAPLVILLNSYSASASELFAAAMQDHNRAVIAGSRSFGKSTAQLVLPLDAYKQEQPEEGKGDSEGYVKLTISKFYRVTGNSHQKEGINPDIRLPSLHDGMEVGESAYPTALNASVIEKKTYYSPFEPLPITELQKRSEQRIKKDSAFIHIKEKNRLISNKGQQFNIPLQPELFKLYADSVYFNHTEPAIKNHVVYLVKNPAYVEDISSFTGTKKEINKSAINDIENDHYIREAFFIINDWIELTTN